MKNVIHIFGASGSGTSTLGRYIRDQLGYKFMDSDDYFWLPTDPPFTEKRPPEERVAMMRKDIEEADNVVNSGSLVEWGDSLIPYFTLAVRLVTPTEVRRKRIKERELLRYGDRILPGGDMHEQHESFLEWALKYDDGDIEIRSKLCHDEWQKLLRCPVLVLSGEAPLAENLEKIKKYLK